MSLPVGPLSGVMWLISCCLLILSVVLFLLDKYSWSYVLALAVIMSQILIFISWQDAKYGTILNFVFLSIAVISLSGHRFQSLCRKEVESINDQANAIIVSENDIQLLPVILRKWIEKSGTLNHRNAKVVEVIQDVELKLKPDQEKWYRGRAEQFITYNPPAFHWKISLDMFPLVWMRGRDVYSENKASMLILIENILPMANIKNEEKLIQGSAIRYLAEVVLFPYGALQKDIKWYPVNETTVQATFYQNGIPYSGVFHFNASGDFIRFESKRFRGTGADAVLSDWVITAGETIEIDGIFIPQTLEITWNLEGKNWTWYKLKIKTINFYK